MPNPIRSGLILILLVLIALGLPALAAAAQANDPTPLFTPTPLPTLPAEETPVAVIEVTAEPEQPVEATQEAQQLPGQETGRVEPVDGGSIDVGDTVEDELTEDALARYYTLTGSADQTVRITLVSEDFDTYLVLEDENGAVLDTDDDSAGSYDSRIAFTLPADGEYRIIAQSFSYYNRSGAATGAYTLTVEEIETLRIEYSQDASGELTNDELTRDYQFIGQEGDTIIINLTSPTFDTYLTLLDDSGMELAYNDDSGGSLNSQIGPYTLPYTGVYTISVNSYSRSSTGAYTLSLNKVDLQTIAYGDSVDVEITAAADTFFFTFEGNAGEVVNIYVESSDGDANTSLSLNDPYNSMLVSDQDSGRRYDPEIIDFVLTTSGTHTILLNTVSGTGTVKLTVERGVLPSLDEGSQQVSFSSSGSSQTRVVSFTAIAGQPVRLTVRALNGAGYGSPNISVMQQGSSIAYASASYVSGTSIDFTPTSAGETLIQISEYSYTDISYEVSIEPIE
jgi:hypothetical protein